MKKQVTISLAKPAAPKKDLKVREQVQLNEHFKALIKEEAETARHYKSQQSNDSLDLVQMEDDIEPKKSLSPERADGFQLRRSASPILNAYDAPAKDLDIKQRYSSAVNTSHQIAGRFSTNSLFNTSGLGGQGALNASTTFISPSLAPNLTDPAALQQALSKE